MRWDTMKRALATVGFALLAVGALPAAHADKPRIYRENDLALASLRVGKNEAGDVYRRIDAGVIGPLVERELRPCIQAAATGPVEEIRARLAEVRPFTEILDRLQREGTDPTPSAVQSLRADRLEAISHTLGDAQDSFRIGVEKCLTSRPHRQNDLNLPAIETSKFSLGVVLRICEPGFGHPGPCQLATESVATSEERFAKLAEWINTAVNTRLAANAPPAIGPPLNRWYLYGRSGWQAEEVEEDDLWLDILDDDDKKVAVHQYEELVKEVRSVSLVRDDSDAPARLKFSYVLPWAAGLSAQNVERTLELTEWPSYALPLVEHFKSPPLEHISDEVARSRIFECTRVRQYSDPADIAKCSGYEVNAEQLMKCARGGQCLPNFSPTAKAYQSVATLVDSLDALRKRGELAPEVLLPRVANIPAVQYTEAMKNCLDSNQSDAARSKCILEKAASKEYAAIKDCLPGGANGDVVACAKKAFNVNEPLLDCIPKGSGHQVDLGCVAGAASPVAKRFIDCAKASGKNGSADVIACLTKDGPGKFVGRVEQAQACLASKPGNDPATKALCLSDVAGIKGPLVSDIRSVVDCVHQSKGDQTAFALCAAGGHLQIKNANVARLVQCETTSAGNQTSAAVCMVSDRLNPTARILVACAATSAGGPEAFAGCALGQLTMQTLAACRGKRIGHDGCFGPSNDLVKWSKRLLGVDPTKVPVFSDYLNAEIQLLSFEEGLIEKAIPWVARGVARDVRWAGKQADRAGVAIDRFDHNVAATVADGIRKASGPGAAGVIRFAAAPDIVVLKTADGAIRRLGHKLRSL